MATKPHLSFKQRETSADAAFEGCVLSGNRPVGPYLMRFAEVNARTGFKKQTLRNLEAAGKFPSRIYLTSCSVCWDSDSISLGSAKSES